MSQNLSAFNYFHQYKCLVCGIKIHESQALIPALAFWWRFRADWRMHWHCFCPYLKVSITFTYTQEQGYITFKSWKRPVSEVCSSMIVKTSDHAMIQWIWGVKIKQQHSTEELRRRLDLQRNKDVLRWNRLGLSGHSCWQEETTWMKKILNFVADRTNSLDRPKLR